MPSRRSGEAPRLRAGVERQYSPGQNRRIGLAVSPSRTGSALGHECAGGARCDGGGRSGCPDCRAALAKLQPLPGRGRQSQILWRDGTLTLIDESYDASPAAVRAALGVLAGTAPGPGARRVAVLGDMLELGDASEQLHRELAEPLAAAKVARVFLIGEAMVRYTVFCPIVCVGVCGPRPTRLSQRCSAF